MTHPRLLAGLAIALLSMLPLLPAGAIDLRFATADGTLTLAQLRGKVVYLDYWASWCGPCRQSFPWMNEMQQRYGDKGLVVVAVNVDRERAEAQRFLAAQPARFVIAYDPEGETARMLKLKGMPSSFLIGRDGRIVAEHIGFREAERQRRESEIRAALTE